MPIDAKFTADFSQFATATKGAQSELDKLIAKSDTTQKSIAKMSDAAAGKFTVTTAEMKKAGFATQDWTKDLSRFDGVLRRGRRQHLQPGPRDYRTEGGDDRPDRRRRWACSGRPAVAAGVALAGWQLARDGSSDVFDLDQKVAGLTGSLGALAAQTDAAKQDAINKAIRDGAAATITYTDAIAYDTKGQQDHILVTGFSRDAASEAGKAYALMFREIRAVRERGDLPALTRDLQSYDYSLQTLARGTASTSSRWSGTGRISKAVADQEKAARQGTRGEQGRARQTDRGRLGRRPEGADGGTRCSRTRRCSRASTS